MAQRIFYLVLAFFFSCVHGLAQEKSYFNQTEVGLTFGKSQEMWDGSQEERIDFTFYTFHGAYLSPKQVLGFAIGFDQYEELSLMPFTVGWKGFLGKQNKPQLIGGLDLGGASALFEKRTKDEWSESWYEGGFLLSPSAGIKLPAKKGKGSLSLTFAYKRQAASYLQGTLDRTGNSRPATALLPPGFSYLNETNYTFHSFVFRAGLIF